MSVNKEMEFVVIIDLSDEVAQKLNINNVNGVCYGIIINCRGNLVEDDRNSPAHGNMKRRVFRGKGVESGDECEICLINKKTGKKEAKNLFVIPNNQNCVTIKL